MSAIPTEKHKERAFSALAGVFFIGYGIYYGTATGGTFFFPYWMFAVPFVLVVVLGAAVHERWIQPRMSRPASVDIATPVAEPESAAAAPVDRSAPNFGSGTAFSSSAVASSPDPSRPFLYGSIERP